MAQRPGGLLDVQSDAMWAALVRSSHDAIVVLSTDFVIIACNPAAERLYGHPASDLRGKPVDVLIPPEVLNEQHKRFRLVAAGAELDRVRSYRLHRDGQRIPVSLAISPLCDSNGHIIGLSSSARRITDRERLEAGLQALLEAAPDAVIGVADDGRVMLCNAQAQDLFGLPHERLVGKAVDELIVPPPAQQSPPATGRAGDDAASPSRPPVMARHVDGSTVPVEVSVSVVDSDQGRVRCAVIRDITERLRAQNEYLKMQAEAERARVEAQLQRARRLESLGQLAGGVAHDFNNIIAVIVNYAGFIAEEATQAGLTQLAADAEQISRAGQRGAELTHQLLSFARRDVTRPRVLDINEVVRDVEQMLRRSIGEHITLTTGLTDTPLTVTADPGQLEQVLVNLAVNARDAMPRGGHLTIQTCVIDVDADYATHRPELHPGRYVRLRVSDTGTGMPKDVVERAFEPFFTTKPTGQGTGLGLATVYGIITAAGGDLSIYSEPGMGTTISILLPATDQAPIANDDTPAAAVAPGGGELILAVEDEPALRQVTRRVLSAAGYRVVIAEDGPSALRLAEQHASIDLLLTDVVMPHMLGKELAERLTATHPETRVLFMSGYAQPVLASQGTLDADVTLVEKPFTKPQLLKAVRDSLNHHPVHTRTDMTALPS